MLGVLVVVLYSYYFNYAIAPNYCLVGEFSYQEEKFARVSLSFSFKKQKAKYR